MISISIDNKQFEIDMNNIIQYSNGFLDGAKRATPELLKNLGNFTLDGLKKFIDSNAKIDPAFLSHVYEWYQVGSPDARLFDISFTYDQDKINFSSQFTQSSSVQHGSNIPFFDKAKIMEYGMAVTVTPRGSNPLVFHDGGETIFTKAPVTIENPGGVYAHGAYQKVFDLFFNSYFSQSFLKSSGIIDYLSKPEIFKTGMKSGKTGGKSAGNSIGYNWIAGTGKVL